MSAEHVHACTAVMLNTYAAICCGCGRGKWVCRFINIGWERAAGILSARRARRAQAMPGSISEFLTNEVVVGGGDCVRPRCFPALAPKCFQGQNLLSVLQLLQCSLGRLCKHRSPWHASPLRGGGGGCARCGRL